MKTYNVSIDSEAYIYDVIELTTNKLVEKIINTLTTKEFYEYFGEKLMEQLQKIANEEVLTIDGEAMQNYDKTNYLSSMGMEIRDNAIYLYNDAVIDDIPSRVSDPEKLANYPLKLSLAKIVEYGIGNYGFVRPLDIAPNWQYDMNDNGRAGWTYKDLNGNSHHTTGIEGRMVFYKTLKWLEDGAKPIVYDYLVKKLKD